MTLFKLVFYFVEYEKKIKDEAMSNKPCEPEKDYPSTVVAAIVATFAMVAYAFSVGIVQVNVEESVVEHI